jgi:hypothetical protein
MTYNDQPPAAAMALGAFLAWCVFAAIVLGSVKLLASMTFGITTSTIQQWHKLGRAIRPPPEVVVNRLLETTGMQVQEPEVKRAMLPGLTFGKKSVAERMVETTRKQHPELNPALKETKQGWGVEIDDIEQ